MSAAAQQVIDSLVQALEGGQFAQAKGLVAALDQLVPGDAGVKAAKEYLALAPRVKETFAKVLGHGVVAVLRAQPLAPTHTALAKAVRADPGAATVFLGGLSSSPELNRLFGVEVSNAVHDTAHDETAQGPLKGKVSVPMATGGVLGGVTVAFLALRVLLKLGAASARDDDAELNAAMFRALAEQRMAEAAQARAIEQHRPVPEIEFCEAPAAMEAAHPNRPTKLVLARFEVEAFRRDEPITPPDEVVMFVGDEAIESHQVMLLDAQGRELFADQQDRRWFVLVFAVDAVPPTARFGWRSRRAYGEPTLGPPVTRLSKPFVVTPVPPPRRVIEGFAKLGTSPHGGDTRWVVVLRYTNVNDFQPYFVTLEVESGALAGEDLPPTFGALLDDARKVTKPLDRFELAPHEGTAALVFDLPDGIVPRAARYRGDALKLPRPAPRALPEGASTQLLNMK